MTVVLDTRSDITLAQAARMEREAMRDDSTASALRS
jgi:hypothetical protein